MKALGNLRVLLSIDQLLQFLTSLRIRISGQPVCDL
ncbi:Uncharacterised protein [Vibrio cholerae]|nr:Uncharacterised protein [Vibrio cholerae]